MHSSFNSRNSGRPAQSYSRKRGSVPFNFQSVSPPFMERKHEFGREYRPDHYRRDSFDHCRTRPKFILDLSCSPGDCMPSKADIDNLVGKCKRVPEVSSITPSHNTAAKFQFSDFVAARETTVCLWKARLDGDHLLTPVLYPATPSPSVMDELRERIKGLFLEWTQGLLNDEFVVQWQKKLETIQAEIDKTSKLLKKGMIERLRQASVSKKETLLSEKDLILRRINEYRSGITSITSLMEGNPSHGCEPDDVEIFKFEGDLDWNKIHHVILRERRRFQQGLPIYSFRQEILHEIRSQQVIVLIGETGSGKSTQLVQFLVDSGMTASGTVVCTQPRKIAAISLSHRVAEESRGCYDDASVVFHPTRTSLETLRSRIAYLTDHCLLHHYMNRKSLSGISCVIIDEAHERSLNTDLLLASLKGLLFKNSDLRLVIMSATADADKLSQYFFGCRTLSVSGRAFPVEIKYAPCASGGSGGSGYASDVVRTVTEIDRMETEGTVLAFLTSQAEVEWACENFRSPTAVAFPLHGRLLRDDQLRVFSNCANRRKVVFATNIAETSLTIPGVRYVVDPGVVKESKFDPRSGMNILRANRISQSSANQRAGRAGRTEPGKCYRLYSEREFLSMQPHQDPEIKRVHLGIAILRILALGLTDVRDFDFVDAPSAESIDTAVQNLVLLGAVASRDGSLELTGEGRSLAAMGIEPRLGKLIHCCFDVGLPREGLVLASVMSNSSSIFCRVGTDDEKWKSDRLKLQFCHRAGDLFTLLSVYKEWTGVAPDRQNGWCWDNSINAKSMRRCHGTVNELEFFLETDSHCIFPTYWSWDPRKVTDSDARLSRAILASLPSNVAAYTGHDHLGYQLPSTLRNIQLHPSCSLLAFGDRPDWVVFSEILSSASNDHLVCATSIDAALLLSLSPPVDYDVASIDARRLRSTRLAGFGTVLLKKFCGRLNASLHRLSERVRTECSDDRIRIEVNADRNEVIVFAPSVSLPTAVRIAEDALALERKWMINECVEKSPHEAGFSALFGAGFTVVHLELDRRSLTVDVHGAGDDKSLLVFFESRIPDAVCGFQRSSRDSCFRVTFATPEAADEAVGLSGTMFGGAALRVVPRVGDDRRAVSSVRARVRFPRRLSNGFVLVKCSSPSDVDPVVFELSLAYELGLAIRCTPSSKYDDGVVISGVNKNLSETEIAAIVSRATTRRIRDLHLIRGSAVSVPPPDVCADALSREISRFVPRAGRLFVQVFEPDPKDWFVRGAVMFDGRLHLEAARALEHLEGNVLPGFLPWQKIKCEQLFQTSIYCSPPIYAVVRSHLDSVLSLIRRRPGVDCALDRTANGSYRVKISANATRLVAEARKPLEELMMKGTVVRLPWDPRAFFSREGAVAIRSVESETGTHVIPDRRLRVVRVFGPPDGARRAEDRLVRALLGVQENRTVEVRLRGDGVPSDLMREVVRAFGPELGVLKEFVPEADCGLNTRRHVITVRGGADAARKVEELVSGVSGMSSGRPSCPICLCDVEDGYRLETCGHVCCRGCLVEQCASAARSHDGFPLGCVEPGCSAPLWVEDVRSLVSAERMEELCRASLSAHVASSVGKYRFCPSPDCPSVYRASDSPGAFVCGACYAETCTGCHADYHPYVSCEGYEEYKRDPDSSLKDWCKGKEHVKGCPSCGSIIEKGDGCNHVRCLCGAHICWNCLRCFSDEKECYAHLHSVHLTLT